MLRYEITHFIHSTLRKNKLMHLIDALFEDTTLAKQLLWILSTQFKTFLSKEHVNIFEDDRLKYITYLGEFTGKLDGICDPNFFSKTDIHLHLLEFYELPKKRNNLFALLLLYFCFSKQEYRGKNQIIVELIYLYILIITYRNGFGAEIRKSIIALDTLRFRTFKEMVSTTLDPFIKRYTFLQTFPWKHSASIFLAVCITFGTWMFTASPLAIRADVLSAQSNHMNISKVAIDSLLLGRITDTVSGTVSEIGLQNLLLIALAALIFQSLRTGFTNLFVNSFLVKSFEFIGTTLRIGSRLIFSLYNYCIYKLETRFMFESIHWIVRERIRPNIWILSTFLILYVAIYFWIINLYIGIIGAVFFPMYLAWGYVLTISGIITGVLIFANVRTDIWNFEKFLLKFNEVLGELSKKPVISAVKEDISMVTSG